MASGTTVANLKMIFSSDTTGLEKGAKTAKQSVKDFDSTVEGATANVAKMFGVDTAAIDKMTSSLRGLGNTLKDSANEGTASFGKMLASINATQAAIAGIGIAAAVASFKMLNSEADYFKSTIEGANIEMATAAYVSAYSAALHDMNLATGKGVAEFEAKVKEGWGRFVANTKQGFVNALEGDRTVQSLLAGPFGIFYNTPKSEQKQAAQIAQTVKDLTVQQNDLQDQLNVKMGEWAKIEARIASLRYDMVDPTLSISERQAALAEAQQLVTDKAAEEKAIRDDIAKLQEEINKKTTDTREGQLLLSKYLREAENVDIQRDSTLKSLLKTSKTLSAEAAKEAAARKEAAEAAAAQLAAHQQLMAQVAGVTSLDLSTSGGLAGLLPKGVTGPDGAIEVKFKPVIDQTATLDLTNELVSLAENMSSAIGGLVGDLVTGGDAWGNFKNAALTAFADMAISVGKLAVATGTAALGIKAALESLNPYVAIAAGAALIALGAAVKSGLSNVASGNYSSGTASLATAGYSSRNGMNGGYALREITVEVTGTLKGDGDQLIGVINTTNNRNSHTT